MDKSNRDELILHKGRGNSGLLDMKEGEYKMKGVNVWFWISHSLKNISFHPVAGFEKIAVDTYMEMWDLIYKYIEEGYRVG